MRIDTKQRIWKKFLTLLTDELSRNNFCDVAVVSFLNGHPNDTTQFSDLDLLIILNNPPLADPTNSKNYLILIKILKNIQKKFNKNEIYFCVFPTHKVEEFTRKLVYEEFNSKYNLVHLLAYPSLNSFVSWEPPSIVESVCKTGQVIYGDEAVMKQAQDKVKELTFKQRIEPLLVCLYESYRYFECSQISDPVICSDAFHMLDYVVKYLCGEFLIHLSREKTNIPITEAYSWETIINKKSELANPELLDFVYKTRKDRKNLSVPELRRFFIQCFDMFNSFLQESKLQSKES